MGKFSKSRKTQFKFYTMASVGFSGPCYHNVNYGITLHRLWYWQCLQSRTYNAFPMCLNLVINSYYKNTVTILPILGRNCDLGNL